MRDHRRDSIRKRRNGLGKIGGLFQSTRRKRVAPARRRSFVLLVSIGLLSATVMIPVISNLGIQQAAAATAGAVIPDSAISGFTPVQFPANDDGTYPCGGTGNAPPPCPAGATGPAIVPFGFNINFYGSKYGGAYINNNGNITLDSPLATYTPVGLEGTSSVIIAPFFADVDTRVGNNVEFGTGTLNGHSVFVVNWPGVGCFNENNTVTDNFQLILIDRSDRGSGPLGDNFDIEFNYNSIQWDAGQASGGNSNCTNTPPTNSANSAVVGFSNGTPTADDSYQLPGSQSTGALLDSNTATGLIHNDLNSTVPGRYVFNVNGGSPSNGFNVTACTSANCSATATGGGTTTTVSCANCAGEYIEAQILPPSSQFECTGQTATAAAYEWLVVNSAGVPDPSKLLSITDKDTTLTYASLSAAVSAALREQLCYLAPYTPVKFQYQAGSYTAIPVGATNFYGGLLQYCAYTALHPKAGTVAPCVVLKYPVRASGGGWNIAVWFLGYGEPRGRGGG